MRRTVIRLLVTLGAGVALWFLLDLWIGDRTSLTIDVFDLRPIELLAPERLFIIAIVPVFYLLRVVSLTDLSLSQQVLQATLRSLVIAAVAFALARPTWVTERSEVATIVLVDVSDSVSDKQLEAARHYVDSFAELGNVQVVTFAEKPRAVRAPDGQLLSAAIVRHAGAGAGTDVQSAMQLAYGLYPDGFLPRMVIVTDGNQTAGDLAIEAYRARDLGVKVSWRTFEADRTSEVRVVGLTVPDRLTVGAPYEVTAEVWSTEEQTVTLHLDQDRFANALDHDKTVKLHEGKNLVKFKSDAKRAGATTYTVKLASAEHDTEKANNAAVMTAPVTGKPRVLYVEGGVTRDPTQASYFAHALEHENIDVEIRGPAGMPTSASELDKYDFVVMSDVPSYLVGESHMAALDAYVASNGGGFMMAGGQDSFGSGGYRGTRMEQILPVTFDGRKDYVNPDVALALLIDRSDSMSGEKLEAAKTAARVTAEKLAPRDYLAVVAFDSEAHLVVPPMRASSRVQISSEIGKLTPGGGTNFYPALKQAYDALAGVEAKVKHVILLSDGEADSAGIVELVNEMHDAKITVSCVGVQGADRRLLGLIAEAGHGRIEMVDDLRALPRFFVHETEEMYRSPLIEDAFFVKVQKPVEAIEGTGVAAAPALHGYVSVRSKPLAETILAANVTDEPILVRWHHGGGQTIAWTSDVKNRWSTEWIHWPGYPKFWAQVIRSSMKHKTYDSYELAAKVADGRAYVSVDAIDATDRFVNELDTTLEVIDPATTNVVQKLPMQQTAAGRYAAAFRLDRYGSYLLKAVHQRAGKTVAESLGAIALSYPLEYLRTTPDREPLVHAARVSGGFDQPEPARVVQADGESLRAVEELWPYALIGVVFLLILDLYAKRVRLFGYRAIAFR